MKVKTLQEGWVKFRRMPYVQDSYIDFWVGDGLDNPNNQYKNKLNFNSFTSFLRLNGKGPWVNIKKFRKNPLSDPNLRDQTAINVWNNFLIN